MPDATDSIFTWTFTASSGDSWGGSMVDDSARYDVGSTLTTAWGRYTVVAEAAQVTDLGVFGLEEGWISVGFYRDAGGLFMLTQNGESTPVGFAGFGSEADAAWNGTEWDAFGGGGADQASPGDLADSLFTWTFAFDSGDYLFGTLLDDSRDWAIGDTVRTARGSYIIVAETSYGQDLGSGGTEGTVRTQRYLDGASDVYLTLESGGAAPTGYGGLGSEVDRAWTGAAWVPVGQGGALEANRPADRPSGNDSMAIVTAPRGSVHVNSTAGLDQTGGAVAIRADGSVVVAYIEAEAGSQAFVQVFSRDGLAQGGRIAVAPGLAVRSVEVAADAFGGFAVAYDNAAGATTDVAVASFSPDGSFAFRTALASSARQELLGDAAFRADGSLFVTFQEEVGGSFALRADVVGTNGAVLVDNETLFSSGTASASGGNVAMLSGGGRVAAFEVNGSGFVALRSPAGVLTTVAVVPPAANHIQQNLDVTGLSTGGFAVVWRDLNLADPTQATLRGRVFNASGAGLGAEQVIVSDTAQPAFPDVAATGDGGFLLAYQNPNIELRSYAVQDGSIRLVSNLLDLNEAVDILPDLALGADGRFAVAWGAFDDMANGPGDVVSLRQGLLFDVTYGAGGAEAFAARGGADLLDAGGGADTIETLGTDTIFGGNGDDVILDRSGNDGQRIDGGAGFDVFVSSGSRSLGGDQIVRTDATVFFVDWQKLTVTSVADVEGFRFGGAGSPLVLTEDLPGFDGLGYVASYADLMVALRVGATPAALAATASVGAQHYAANGIGEGREILFGRGDYLANYADLGAAFGANGEAGMTHYMASGFAEHRLGRDGLDYIASYPDLIAAFGANRQVGATHYANQGWREGRQVSFDPAEYLANYADLRSAFGNNGDAAAAHYITNGFAEHRLASSAADYVAANADLSAAFAYRPGGELRSAAEIAALGVNHFGQFGWREARDTTFDGHRYLMGNFDLRQAFGNDEDKAAYNFIGFGRAEGSAGDMWG